MLDPETGVILFIIGGIGTVATFMGFKIAQEAGPRLELGDLLPAPPPSPPLPRFMFTKPKLLEELRKG